MSIKSAINLNFPERFDAEHIKSLRTVKLDENKHLFPKSTELPPKIHQSAPGQPDNIVTFIFNARDQLHIRIVRIKIQLQRWTVLDQIEMPLPDPLAGVPVSYFGSCTARRCR